MASHPAEQPPVRTHYAPSSTGFPHIGYYRTALLEWLAAKHGGGQFLPRVEDTDLKRLAAARERLTRQRD